MATFEHLLGPYPFERYSVVLVPELGGGMENATITFADELSGQGNVAFNLHAHELAHHWFGDHVTVESFDDLWIKEGLATLLAAEADRARRNGEHTGRLLGRDFRFNSKDKIRDLDLPLYDRYTSGPYTRAAWLLTQIRARVGDDAFWGTLREVLAEHALGHIDSERFLESFAPELDAATLAKAVAALGRQEVPAIAIGENGAAVSFTVSDPGEVLIAPLTVTPIQADGSPGPETTLMPDRAVSVTIPGGGYLALDEREAHIEWTDSFDVEGYDALAPFLAPAAPGAAMNAFLSRSAAQQERALWSSLRLTDAAALAGFYAGLDSTVAKRYAELDACRNVQANLPSWVEELPAILRSPSLSRFSTAYGACGVTLATATFGAELVALAAAPSAAARLSHELRLRRAGDVRLAVAPRRVGAEPAAPRARHHPPRLPGERLWLQRRTRGSQAGLEQLLPRSPRRGDVTDSLPRGVARPLRLARRHRPRARWRQAAGGADERFESTPGRLPGAQRQRAAHRLVGGVPAGRMGSATGRGARGARRSLEVHQLTRGPFGASTLAVAVS
jgi:hypothetical protein